jgi:hypothetical protein
LDTVAHCGHTLKGEFLRTLSATDPVTGWTMLRSIRNNAFVHVHAGLEWIAKLAPLPIAGMDFDNGSEFMNWSVIAWCDDHHILSCVRDRVAFRGFDQTTLWGSG